MDTDRSLVLLMLATLTGGVATPAVAQETQRSVLASRARVRFQVRSDYEYASAFGMRWHTGRVGGGVARCIVVAPDSVTVRDVVLGIAANEPVPQLAVAFEEIARLQVSTIYHGRFVPGAPKTVYEPGADISQEEWIEIAVDSVMRDPTSCPPSPSR